MPNLDEIIVQQFKIKINRVNLEQISVCLVCLGILHPIREFFTHFSNEGTRVFSQIKEAEIVLYDNLCNPNPSDWEFVITN